MNEKYFGRVMGEKIKDYLQYFFNVMLEKRAFPFFAKEMNGPDRLKYAEKKLSED